MSVARTVAALVALLSAATFAGAAAQTSGETSTGPRLRTGVVPSPIPPAIGGGEVVLELAVDSGGAVTGVERLRVTPPYTEQLVQTTSTWQFEPARTLIEKRLMPVSGPVLVVALIRPPSIYNGPSLGTPPQTLDRPSSRLPQLMLLTTPSYPPVAIGGVMVLVEIEMNRRAQALSYRVVGPTSGFDTAALAALREWRFSPPDAVDAPERLFVYALLGFREPVAPTPRPPSPR